MTHHRQRQRTSLVRRLWQFWRRFGKWGGVGNRPLLSGGVAIEGGHNENSYGVLV
jgi:hypothetical protein